MTTHTTPKDGWTKRDAWAWFQDLLRSSAIFYITKKGIEDSFRVAWAERVDGTRPEAWRAWIRRTFTEAKTKDVPRAWFWTMLQQGPDCNLCVAPDPGADSPRRNVHAENADAIRKIKAQTLLQPEERPSLLEATRIRRELGDEAMKQYLKPFQQKEKTL